MEEKLLCDCFTLGNALLAFLFLLILNQLIELYQFRGMPPGPRLKSLPFIGNLFSFDSTGPTDSFLDSTKSLRKKYGAVFSMKAGSFKFVVAADADSAKEVLVKRSADYAGRPPFYTFMLLTTGGKDIAFANDGPAWRFHRKLFMSALRQYLSDQQIVEERISEQATRMLNYFEDQREMDFNPFRVLTECVANVICRVTFGKHFDSSHPECETLLQLHVDLSAKTELIAQTFVLNFFPMAQYFPFKCYREVKRVVDRIFEILGKQLKEKEETFDASAEVENLTESLLKERIASRNEVGVEDQQTFLSNDYILNSMEDMFSAGFETTSNTLKWALAFLVHHPDVQKEIQEQLDDVVGKNRMPGLDDRARLSLVNATIMETLRLGNVADTTIPHYTLKDTTLAGYRVPKNTVVFVSLQAIHEDPNSWEDPLTFNPHRHLDSEGHLVSNSGNFLPFSAGRRVCAGETLAKVELFLFLSWMLHKFTFLPSEEGSLPDLKGISEFTRTPAPYRIRAVKRN